MNEQLTVYEKAVTTDRSAETLARKHGFKNLDHLAESQPSGAVVLDAGAGASPFGSEVAKLRPDLRWVNFDYSYNDPAILGDVSKDAPENVEFVAGDVTKLGERYEPETFDAIFSYWLLPHLSIDNPKPALEAAKAIFVAAKTGALISVGPKVRNRHQLSAFKISDNGSIDADDFARIIVGQTRLSPVVRRAQKRANEVATPFFGTTRYVKRGPSPMVFHPKSREYVPFFSRKGFSTMGRLALAMAHYTFKHPKSF